MIDTPQTQLPFLFYHVWGTFKHYIVLSVT